MQILQNYLNKKINSQKANINKIDEDISRYEKAQDDAVEAENGFYDAGEGMKTVVNSLQGVFEGETADALSYKMERYVALCTSRRNDMKSLTAECSRRINSLEEQKKKAQASIDKLNEWLSFAQKINL